MQGVDLFITITDRSRAEQFAAWFRTHGISLVLTALGQGTATTEVLDFLGLEATEKAVLFSVGTPACKETLVKELVSTMHLTAPGSGIAVCLPLSSIGGKSAMNYLTSGDPSKAPEIDIEEDEPMKEAAYQLIVAIANQGYTDKVMEAARSAGARGGTIVHTRSTGAEDAGKFFGMSIDEEREMIFIVAPTGEKNAIMKAIMAQAGPSTKAQAITLSLALEDVVGLFTTNPDQ